MKRGLTHCLHAGPGNAKGASPKPERTSMKKPSETVEAGLFFSNIFCILVEPAKESARTFSSDSLSCLPMSIGDWRSPLLHMECFLSVEITSRSCHLSVAKALSPAAWIVIVPFLSTATHRFFCKLFCLIWASAVLVDGHLGHTLQSHRSLAEHARKRCPNSSRLVSRGIHRGTKESRGVWARHLRSRRRPL